MFKEKASGNNHAGSYKFADNFFTWMDPTVSNLDYIIKSVAGEFYDDFDIEAVKKEYLETINEITKRYGVDVTASGVAYQECGKEVDSDALLQEIKEINLIEILQKHDNSNN